MNFLTAVPITDDWTIIGTLARTVQDANLPNFEFNTTPPPSAHRWRF